MNQQKQDNQSNAEKSAGDDSNSTPVTKSPGQDPITSPSPKASASPDQPSNQVPKAFRGCKIECLSSDGVCTYFGAISPENETKLEYFYDFAQTFERGKNRTLDIRPLAVEIDWSFAGRPVRARFSTTASVLVERLDSSDMALKLSRHGSKEVLKAEFNDPNLNDLYGGQIFEIDFIDKNPVFLYYAGCFIFGKSKSVQLPIGSTP